MDREDSGVAADITEMTVRGTRKNLAVIAAQKFELRSVYGIHGFLTSLKELHKKRVLLCWTLKT